MLNTQTLVEAYTLRPRESRSAWRSLGGMLLAGWQVVLTVGALAWIVYNVWTAWQTSDWFPVAIAVEIGIIVLIFSAFPAEFMRRRQPAKEASRAMREIVRRVLAAGEADTERLAPRIVVQPAPLAPGELPVGTEEITPIALVRDSLATRRMLAVLAVPFLLLFFAPFYLMMDSPFDSSLSHFFLPYGLTCGGFLLLLVVGIGITARTTVLATRGRVCVDALGASWRQGREEARIEWARATAFFRVTYQAENTASMQRVTSVLDTPDGALSWSLGGPLTKDPHHAASDRLASLIVTRTGLPLRDLTGLTTELLLHQRRLPRFYATLKLPGAPLTLPAAPKRGGAIARWVAWILLAVALPAGGAYGLSQYQGTYYASLPGRLQAETPRFADSLASASGAWDAFAPTKNDPTSFVYVDGEYRMTGEAGSALQSLAPSTYGDVAVGVTARQLVPAINDQTDGVGLVLRANPQDADALYFEVTPQGEASLFEYSPVSDPDPSANWHFLDDEHSSAIHTGVGAANRLLVVMRGGLYLCYVNDTLVLTYYNGGRFRFDLPTPTAGQVGLRVEDGAVGGAFSDFAVYPVQPSNSFWYV